MKRTGIFITADELEHLKTAQQTSGMFLSGGRPIGDPASEAAALCKKYDMAMDSHGIDLKNGEFVQS